MKMASLETTAAADWRKMHALGLPAGSVRALLAVVVFATVWGLLLLRPGQEIPDYLSDLMFVILGHYFATRKRSGLVAEASELPGPPPLYLPRGTIRLLLALGSIAVAGVLYERGAFMRMDRNPGVATLLLVGGFLLGVLLNAAVAWWRARVKRGHRAVEDFQALISLAAGAALTALVWNQFFPVVPADELRALFQSWTHMGRLGPEHVLAAVIGLYFGSRS